MKIRKFNNIIEEEIMRCSLALNENNPSQHNLKDEKIKRLAKYNFDGKNMF